MPDTTRGGESTQRTLLVALVVSLVCSSLVAGAAVVLRPRQIANSLVEEQRSILEVAGLLVADREVREQFERIETRLVDLETGEYVEGVDLDAFDAAEAAKDPQLSVAVPPEIDGARIGRRANWGLVYLVRRGASVDKVVLPVSGYGLWSTMYGFISLESDGNSVVDLTFYEHGETPGLGDQIADPAWRAHWEGKQVRDDSGTLRLEVVKGSVSTDDPSRAYKVDGITGATLTGNGVTRLIHYWLGDHGYGPYLRRLEKGEAG